MRLVGRDELTSSYILRLLSHQPRHYREVEELLHARGQFVSLCVFRVLFNDVAFKIPHRSRKGFLAARCWRQQCQSSPQLCKGKPLVNGRKGARSKWGNFGISKAIRKRTACTGLAPYSPGISSIHLRSLLLGPSCAPLLNFRSPFHMLQWQIRGTNYTKASP